MCGGFFKPPVFIRDIEAADIDLSATPFLYNDAGVPRYLASPPAGVIPLQPAPQDPSLEAGFEHSVTGPIGAKSTQWGVETELGFAPGDVRYEPMWATPETARAFGITLVQPGQAVNVQSPHPVQQVEYEYGVFAGHYNPYTESELALESVVCTDLEHHDFPHVFASTDLSLPLVISVGRYWPKQNRIRLADLWVRRGDALYIPPMPKLADPECVDLHNNRNSARAAWGHADRDAILTHTLLQTQDAYIWWFWNAGDTQHTNLSAKG